MNHSSKKYIEITVDKDSVQKNEWLEYCRQQQMPYITVAVNAELADVSWDCISYPIGSEQVFDEKDEFICRSSMEIFKKFTTKNTQYEISSAGIFFPNIPIENARRAAVEIFELIDGLFENKSVI